MNDQAKHAIQQALLMVAVACLAALLDQRFMVLETLVGHEYAILWSAVIAGLITALIRGVEGMLDQRRAKLGKVIPSDVPYGFVRRQVLQDPQLGHIESKTEDIYVVTSPSPTTSG